MHKKKIAEIMEKNRVEVILAESSVCWPTVFFRIRSLYQLVSQSSFRQPVGGYKWSTVCGFLLHPWLFYSVVPCWLFISTRTRGGSSNIWQYCMYHLHLHLEGASDVIRKMGSMVTLGKHCSAFREDGGCVPLPWTTHLGLSQIISATVKFLMN